MRSRPRTKFKMKLKNRRCAKCNGKLNSLVTRCSRCSSTASRPAKGLARSG